MTTVIKRLHSRLRIPLIRYFLKKNRISFGGIPFFSGYWPDINNEGEIFIGVACSFRSFRLRQHITVRKNAELKIGDYSFLNDGVNLCATGSIVIGHHAKIGDMTFIYDTDFHQISPDLPTRHAPVFIGGNVWIGANSMVLPGAMIGDHTVIAAGSIVTGEIPPKSLAAGSPARVLRKLEIPDEWIRK
jgi:acetyltransferase-like isoleucine patch superfamily enzyme